jgi:hypothetical protein
MIHHNKPTNIAVYCACNVCNWCKVHRTPSLTLLQSSQKPTPRSTKPRHHPSVPCSAPYSLFIFLFNAWSMSSMSSVLLQHHDTQGHSWCQSTPNISRSSSRDCQHANVMRPRSCVGPPLYRKTLIPRQTCQLHVLALKYRCCSLCQYIGVGKFAHDFVQVRVSMAGRQIHRNDKFVYQIIGYEELRVPMIDLAWQH